MSSNSAAAVVVTRGDVDLTEVLASLEVPEISSVLVWDNSKQAIDVKVWGQFLGALRTPEELVYVQDDDCIGSAGEVVRAWELGKIVCNVPPAHQQNYAGKPETLMGFGSVFEQTLMIRTFQRYTARFERDDLFLVECARIFTGLNQSRIKLVDVGVRHLPWATADTRLYRQPDHLERTLEARRRIHRILEVERRG